MTMYLNPVVKKNVQIVQGGPESYMLHIAMKKFSELTPNISRRAGNKEDNTIPRVHVAPTLHGCISGYANVPSDMMYTIAGKGKVSEHQNASAGPVLYKGGYYIYKVQYDLALKPNNKLVFDQSLTGEHWLTTYSEDTVTYPCSIAGRLIPVEYSLSPVARKYPLRKITFHAQIDEDIPIYKNVTISKGYWEFCSDGDEIMEDSIKEISKKTYDSSKKLKTALLGNVESPPSYLEWSDGRN